MTEPELVRLEEQVNNLLELLGRLTKENRSLRAQQESLATERAGLLEKHDQVRNRVDAIVTRLKSLETGI
ncbi:MAG TPA: TIGR02449 family protein [Gammaproteobacteria bacterium]|nr:TIGR02449 family protein [Gammaproteobacteria bacterium]